MHMKACGNVFICRCGIRLCSLGALKRHCKQFGHEPESFDPKPEAECLGIANPSAPAWGSSGASGEELPTPYVQIVAEQQAHHLQLQQHAAATAAVAMAAGIVAPPACSALP